MAQSVNVSGRKSVFFFNTATGRIEEKPLSE
jgi:hypothetical protein